MKISRYMSENLIRLEMSTEIPPLEEGQSESKWQEQAKLRVLEELVGMLNGHARVGNANKLLQDFVHRERKASTALEHGVAVPHIRSMQAKEFTIAFARSREGYWFDAADDQPTHLFFVMAAPPYDDSLYLKVFKSLAELLRYESLRDELMTVASPGEVIRAIKQME